MKMHFFVLSMLVSFNLCAMQQDFKPLVSVYAIPGVDKTGSEKQYVQDVLGDGAQVIPVGTPAFEVNQFFQEADFGQEHCQKYLDEVLKSGEEGVVYATSQGAATALNYVAAKDRCAKVKALVLESPLVSANSTSCRAVKKVLQRARMQSGTSFSRCIPTSIPGLPYIAPYCAKLVHPRYRPTGQQPITSLGTMPKNIPVIIVASRNDPHIDYSDACALYYGLRAQGNNNVYLLSNTGNAHVNVLHGDQEQQRITVRSILHHHGLLESASNQKIAGKMYERRRSDDEYQNEQLSEFEPTVHQPEPAPFKAHYEMLITREKRLWYVEKGMMTLAALAAAKVVYNTVQWLRE